MINNTRAAVHTRSWVLLVYGGGKKKKVAPAATNSRQVPRIVLAADPTKNEKLTIIKK